MVYAVILACIAAVWWHEHRVYRARRRAEDVAHSEKLEAIAAEIEKILVWEFG